MKTKIVNVTPAMAAEWLEPHINHSNRDLRQTWISFLAHEILKGRWKVTHQGIGFSSSGRLLDGQHRLSAIVLAGLAVDVMVTTGMEDDDFRAIDSGIKRAHHERIHLVDSKDENQLICMAVRTFLNAITKRGAISVCEIEDEFLKRTESWMWVGTELSRLHGRLRKAPIMASFASYHTADKGKCSEFLTGYINGANLESNSPILRLRNLAMEGSREMDYWLAQTGMRAHLKGETPRYYYRAAEDMLGNKNTSREIDERSKVRQLSARNRFGGKGDAA